MPLRAAQRKAMSGRATDGDGRRESGGEYLPGRDAILVYCVAGAANGLPAAFPAGVDGRPVSLIESRALCAAVTRHEVSAAGGFMPDAERLDAYESVVESLCEARAALPFRYGCLMDSEAGVREMLCANKALFRRGLRDVEGCVEMSIRMMVERNRHPAESTTPPSIKRQAAGGKEYLKVRGRFYGLRDGAVEPSPRLLEKVHSAFQGLFVRTKIAPPAFDGSIFSVPVLSVHFLVRREGEKEFRRAFRRTCRSGADRMLLSGPWPPYNFVPEIPQS